MKEAMASHESAIRPHLTDLSLINTLYEKFAKLAGNVQSSEARKEFIFVVIYLYCPNKFFGGKMPQGLRRAISVAMGVDSSSVSRTCTELMVLYSTYDDFRRGVDRLMQEIEKL